MNLEEMTNEELLNYEKQVENKVNFLNVSQLAQKIRINSLYGAVSNEHFRFFDIRVASAITMFGQLTIQWIAQEINLYFNQLLKTENIDYVIAIDTDSNYLDFSPIVNSFWKNETDKYKICKKIEEFTDKVMYPLFLKKFNELKEYVNASKNKMEMEREVIADVGIWTAKKRYILSMLDKEGERYNPPKLKIMGVESTKSSTPYIVREKLKEAYKICLYENNDKLIKFIKQFRKEFENANIEDISRPSGVNNLDKYSDLNNIYSKGTPIHVRGSLLYNHWIINKKLLKKYETIKEGEKIKYVYLKIPNPIRENVIAFGSVFPRELNLEKYIDYDTQFNKTFLDSLTYVTNSIKWNVKKKSTLKGIL